QGQNQPRRDDFGLKIGKLSHRTSIKDGLGRHIGSCGPLNRNFPKLTEISDKRISVISSDDWVVSPQASKTLAESLQTQVIIENNAGHFLDREGYTEFSALLNIFRTVFSVS
ncbi:alpha/beta hydrolase, partial [Morganella morganii]|uniref:alpha/beta hydrolase n=1 Tax=Morganella morganii TaxID=582 RepID=UPI003EB83CEC